MDVKKTAKVLLTYLFNFAQVIKIKEIGKNPYIENGLCIKSGRGIVLKDNVRIGRNAKLCCFVGEYNKLGTITIGKDCYIVDNFTALSGTHIEIGSDTLIASNVSIIAENHGINPECGVRYGNQELTGNSISIGNNCWIGEKVTILQGVSIGQWSIIGAGAVVTKNIPEYSIAVGNPARVIKRYDFDTHKWNSI